MTNKEAIEELKNFHIVIPRGRMINVEIAPSLNEALDLAIKALETLDCCTYFKQGACGKCLHYEEAEDD